MKKLWVLLLLIAPFVLQYCSSSRKSVKSQETKITYAANIQPMMVANCTPCHFPPKGNKKAYDTYTSVKGDIDEILNRINKNPDEKGFMPFKHPKLSDSTINVFVKWKSDGLVEN
jgi:predicted ATPase with chaperone activity